MEKNLSALSPRGRGQLKRELTLLPLTGVIYFTVCGGGFGIEGLVSYSGPGLALLMLVLMPVIFSIPHMLIVRELSSMMPHEGGAYHWVKQAFGPFAGFMVGWSSWVVSFLDVAIYPVLAYEYLQFIFPRLSDGPRFYDVSASKIVVSGLIIWSVTTLQVKGAKLTGWFNVGIGIASLILLIALGVIGLWHGIAIEKDLDLPFLPMGKDVNTASLSEAFSTGILIILWNYSGWELPAAAGSEIRNPKKTYPRAMVLVLVLAVTAYTVPLLGGLYGGAAENDAYMVWGRDASGKTSLGADLAQYGITDKQISSWGSNADPAAQYGWTFPNIAQVVGTKIGGEKLGSSFGTLMALTAAISMIGLFAGNSLSGTRIPFALAEDGMFPRWMTRVHPIYGTPSVAIIFTACIYWVFATFSFKTLLVADVVLSLGVIVLEFLAVWMLRFKRPELRRTEAPGRWCGLAIITLLAFTVIIVAIGSHISVEGGKAVGIITLAMVATGVVAYGAIRRWIKKDAADVDPFQGDPAEN